MTERKTHFLVFSNPVVGREKEFHEWYPRHFSEVLQVDCFVAGRRMIAESSEEEPVPEHLHLAAYDIRGDINEALVKLGKAVAAGLVSNPDPTIVAMPFKTLVYTVVEEKEK